MQGKEFGAFLGGCLFGLAATVSPGVAAARSPPSPYSYCASAAAKSYRFDHGLGQDWAVSERPMKGPAAPYPDGSIDGDTAANVLTGDNGLQLMARKAGAGFTGSRVLSRRLMRYGCVEVVARLPRGRGLWPAVWLRTPYDGSPINGEIDLLEGYGSHPGVVMSTLHHWRDGIDADSAHRRVIAGVDRTFTCAKLVADVPQSALVTRLALVRAKLAGADRSRMGNWLFANDRNACALHAIAADVDFSRDFHRYLLVWTPDRMIWALDGDAYFATTDGIPQVAMMVVMGLSVGALDGGVTAATPPAAALEVKSLRLTGLRSR